MIESIILVHTVVRLVAWYMESDPTRMCMIGDRHSFGYSRIWVQQKEQRLIASDFDL